MRELDERLEAEEKRAEAARDTFTEERQLDAILERANHFRAAVLELRLSYQEARRNAEREPSRYGDPEDPSLSICKSCWKDLKVCSCLRTGRLHVDCEMVEQNGVGPKHGIWNMGRPAPVPKCLAQLPELGRQLLALRLPFQKIVALPRGDGPFSSGVVNKGRLLGSQRGVKGGVINVPSNIGHTLDRLLPHDLKTGKLVSK